MTSYAPGTPHRALCADGVTRTAWTTRHADSFSTVPARVQVRGKTVTGFIYLDNNEAVHFSADAWRRNAGMIKIPLKYLKVDDLFTLGMPKGEVEIPEPHVVIEGGTRTEAGKFLATRRLVDGCPGYLHENTLVRRMLK